MVLDAEGYRHVLIMEIDDRLVTGLHYSMGVRRTVPHRTSPM